jgi:hypothetical protein
MNDPQNKNESETLGSTSIVDESASNTPAPDLEQVGSAEASKPELSSKTTTFPEVSADSKPSKPPVVLAKPAEPPAEPTPAPIPVKLSVAPRPAVTKPAGSPVVDSSISIDGDRDQNVGAIFVDAIAAAVAIAFTVLLAQDVIPFL